jgi:Tfp pilus assembly protein PilO
MRRLFLLGVLGSVLLLVGWWFLFISPRNADIAKAEDELAAAQTQEQSLRTQIVRLEEIRSKEILYIDAIAEMERLIPERPLLESFIEEIYDLSGSSGVDLITLAPAPPVPTDDGELHEINLTAQVRGEFFEIMGFLFGLSELERLVRVDGIALSSNTVEDVTELAVSLDMRLFTLSDAVPVLVPEDGDDGATTTTSEPRGEDVEAAEDGQ